MNFFDQMFKMPTFTPSDPAKTQEAQLERRRQAARKLIEQSMQRTPDTMVGGGGGGGRWQPRPSILVPGSSAATAIAQGAAGYMAARENDAIDEAETAAARQREQQQRDWLARQPGASDAAAVGMPHTPGGEPPTVEIRNQLDMLMGDENKAAMESADNEATMLGAFSNQPGQPVGDDGAYAHPALTATGPTDLPPQGGTEPAQPPQGMNDRDQLRWLLEGAMIEAPGANLLLNQAGNNLLTGEQRREAAQQLASQKYQQQFELQSQRLAQQADLAASRATSAADLTKIKQDYALKLREMDLSLRAAMHNDKMALSRDKQAGAVNPSTGKPMPKTTESERTSAGFLSRMRSAENQFAELESKYGDAIFPDETFSIMGNIPGIGGYVQGKLGGDAQNIYKQQTEDWIRAKLRKESGAVIGDDEMRREYSTYFPLPGDSAAVRRQKAQSRREAEKQFELSSGGALGQIRPAPSKATGAAGPKAGDTHTNSKGVTFVHDGKGWVRQ